jgi:hypothetical protein
MFRLDLETGAVYPRSAGFRAALVLSAPLALLVLVATVAGFLVPGLYRDSPTWVLQAHAQDLVTLVVGVPLLGVSALLASRGSMRGYLLWIGALGYLIYCYVISAFDVQHNSLFLVYVAILGLSIYSVILAVAGVDPRAVARSFEERTPVHLVGWFLIGVCALAALLWLTDEVPATISGQVPASLLGSGLATNPVHVLDLAVVLPGGIVTGLLLMRRQPLGYIFGGYYLVKFATIGLGILAINLFTLVDGQAIDIVPAAIFAVVTVASIVLAWLYLRNVRPARSLDLDFHDSRLSARVSATIPPPTPGGPGR